MIVTALLATALAMLLVRLGWGGRRGAAPAGWLLAGAALLVLTVRDGAWGLSMGLVAAMVAALAVVLHAGWVAPVKMRRAARAPASVTLPRRPVELAKRLGVFVLVVPVAFAATEWLAFGAQAVARRAGAGEADAIVFMLFLQPMLWGGLMTWQMSRANAAGMIAPPLATVLLGTILWSVAW